MWQKSPLLMSRSYDMQFEVSSFALSFLKVAHVLVQCVPLKITCIEEDIDVLSI
jgi:hypothetical protein